MIEDRAKGHFPMCRSAGMLSIALVTCVALSDGASGEGIRSGMRELFDAGAKNTPPAVTAAHQEAVRLKRATPDDLRIDYAYGLVLANQRRYGDAIRLVTRYLQSRPDDLAAWHVRIWAEVQDRRYGDALKSIQVLGDRISKQPAAKRHAELAETARFLGTVFGYLELVQPAPSENDRVSDQKNRLLPQLGETCLSAFDEGRAVVKTALDKMEADREARLKRAEDAAQERKQQAEEALQANREKLANQKEVAQASSEQLQDAGRELNLIRRQLGSLAQDRTRLTAQIITLQAQITSLQSPVDNTVDLRRPGDRYVSSMTTTRIAYDRAAQISVLVPTLAAINKQAFDMDRKILSLQTRGAELTGVSRNEFKTAMESKAAAENAAKKADRLEKQLNRSEATTRSRPTGPTGRMTQFSTYAPLPYEQETKRVLGWFEK